MSYRISYDDGVAAAEGARRPTGAMRSEYFASEDEALRRARQLIDDGEHHAVMLHDRDGRVLAGIRLQLRLGASVAE